MQHIIQCKSRYLPARLTSDNYDRICKSRWSGAENHNSGSIDNHFLEAFSGLLPVNDWAYNQDTRGRPFLSIVGLLQWVFIALELPISLANNLSCTRAAPIVFHSLSSSIGIKTRMGFEKSSCLGLLYFILYTLLKWCHAVFYFSCVLMKILLSFFFQTQFFGSRL